MQDCLFCKIIKGEIKSKKVFENESVFAFEDINPTAPIHILIVPKKHFASLNEMTPQDKDIVGEIFLAAKNIAKEKNIDKSGYRTVFNTGPDAGQAVHHIHLHLLGGRKFSWPAG
ncbi:MAG: histidine triad nucleotide-binding protein [Candidatus Goldbacteria bacterium]|nr:histidine triad nucleotide-binding protein [Candidatus Goldiibacteriota bacterium]